MWTLVNVSKCEEYLENLVAAGQSGVIPIVLNMMHSMDFKVKFDATLILANFSDRLDVAAVADVVALLVQRLQKKRADEFDATRALSKILRHEQHGDTVVGGGGIAPLTRVQQNGS